MLRRTFCCLVLSLMLGTAISGQDLLLTNAQIVDPAARTTVRGSIWIEQGRIVGRGPEAPANAKGERIDLKGRWVIPGLTDLHTHSVLNNAPGGVQEMLGTEVMATRILRAGVTALLDLFAAEDIFVCGIVNAPVKSGGPRYSLRAPVLRPPRDTAPSTGLRRE
jgi:imidazolonepropionase-like amidohydrolase